MAEEEGIIGTLVLPEDYVRHLNRVAGVTTKSIVFVKRRFVSRSGHELVRYPLDSCASVAYFDERPWKTIVTGVLLIGLFAATVILLVATWSQLQPGTRVYPGALALVAVWGARRAFGARRHRLVFRMKDRNRLTWTSPPGEFSTWELSVGQIVAFAKTRGLISSSTLVRTE